jgi:hypothetical protein
MVAFLVALLALPRELSSGSTSSTSGVLVVLAFLLAVFFLFFNVRPFRLTSGTVLDGNMSAIFALLD